MGIMFKNGASQEAAAFSVEEAAVLLGEEVGGVLSAWAEAEAGMSPKMDRCPDHGAPGPRASGENSGAAGIRTVVHVAAVVGGGETVTVARAAEEAAGSGAGDRGQETTSRRALVPMPAVRGCSLDYSLARGPAKTQRIYPCVHSPVSKEQN